MYHLRTEHLQGISLVCAYTNEGGHYIGDQKWAETLQERGIVPELARPGHNTCAIGFCEKEQKWYGWSHRAMYGFGIGSVVSKGDCAYKPKDAQDFLESSLRFWKDEYQADMRGFHDVKDGLQGVRVAWLYNDTVPNEALRGTWGGTFCFYPDSWGRGEWTAETLEDAKQMAIDFAEGVS